MNIQELVVYVVNICKSNNFNKVYICGNGGSGKTTLSKRLCEEASKYGCVNRISTDDFLVDFNIRKNSFTKWCENDIIYSGRYTSSNYESYFMKNINEIIYNIDHEVDCFYFPREYKEKNNIRKLYSNYFLTVIEGVGTAFLDRDCSKSLSIFLKCDKEIEIERRFNRTREFNRDPSELYDEKRSSQYRVNVLCSERCFDLIIESDSNFIYNVL